MSPASKKDVWLASCGGAIEPLIHKEIWVETFGRALNEERAPRSWLIVRDGSWSQEFVLESELADLSETSEKFLQQDFLDQFLTSSALARETYTNVATTFEQKYKRTDDPKELGRWFSEYLSVFENLALHYWGSQTEFLQAPEMRLRELLKSAYQTEEEQLDAMVSLTTPKEKTVIDEEVAAIRELAKDPPTRAGLELHAKRFPWLFYGTFSTDEGVKFIEKRIEEERHAVGKKAKDLPEGVVPNTSGEMAHLSNLFREMAIDRMKLKSCWAGAPYVFLPLFEDIARVIGVTIEELFGTYRADEVRKSLHSGSHNSKETTRARLDSYALLLDKGTSSFHDGAAARNIVRSLLDALPESVSELHGTCASRGNAEGKVRVIRLEGAREMDQDWSAFKEGAVMVVTMTQPNMVPMIRKAAAVITDEGGITSHAAIICRELHIPCVVGTRIATRVLKNGDRVSVNADKGIVRMLADR